MRTVRSDDKRAILEAALSRYEGPLVRFCLRLIGDREIAREIVQEAFLRLWKHRQSVAGEGGGSWLYRVCRNLAFDLGRKRKRQQALLRGLAPDIGPDLGSALESLPDQARVLAALDRLDPSVQEVVLLKFQGGLSYREIAAITDRTVSHVGVILHEAVKEIRRSLDEQPAPRHQGGKR